MCGRPARTVRRGEGPGTQPALPTPIKGWAGGCKEWPDGSKGLADGRISGASAHGPLGHPETRKMDATAHPTTAARRATRSLRSGQAPRPRYNSTTAAQRGKVAEWPISPPPWLVQWGREQRRRRRQNCVAAYTSARRIRWAKITSCSKPLGRAPAPARCRA